MKILNAYLNILEYLIHLQRLTCLFPFNSTYLFNTYITFQIKKIAHV